MATIVQGTVMNGSSEYGVNFKRLIERIVEVANLSILQVNTETTSVYNAYVYGYGNTDIILNLYNQSAYGYVKVYVANSDGTITIGERNYQEITSQSASVNLSLGSSGNVMTFTVYISDELTLIMYCSSSAQTLVFCNMIDILTDELYYCVASNASPLSCRDGEGNVYSAASETSSFSKSSYVRAYPITHCDSVKGMMLRTSKEYNQYYHVAAGSSLLSIGGQKIIKIAGHRFLSTYTSGVFLRID